MFSIYARSEPYQAAAGSPMATAADLMPAADRDRVFRFGHCEMHIARRELCVRDELRPLQPLPFDLLAYLIDQRARVVGVNELLDRFWPNEFVQPGTVTSAIARVRRALADGSDDEVIRTYCRVGYRFVAPLALG